MEHRRLLVFFAAGAGGGFSKKRLGDLGVALHKALKQESDRIRQHPSPRAPFSMHSCSPFPCP